MTDHQPPDPLAAPADRGPRGTVQLHHLLRVERPDRRPAAAPGGPRAAACPGPRLRRHPGVHRAPDQHREHDRGRDVLDDRQRVRLHQRRRRRLELHRLVPLRRDGLGPQRRRARRQLRLGQPHQLDLGRLQLGDRLTDYLKANSTTDCPDSDAEYALPIFLSNYTTTMLETVWHNDSTPDEPGDFAFIHSDCESYYWSAESLKENRHLVDDRHRPTGQGANCDPYEIDPTGTTQSIVVDGTAPSTDFDWPTRAPGRRSCRPPSPASSSTRPTRWRASVAPPTTGTCSARRRPGAASDLRHVRQRHDDRQPDLGHDERRRPGRQPGPGRQHLLPLDPGGQGRQRQHRDDHHLGLDPDRPVGEPRPAGANRPSRTGTSARGDTLAVNVGHRQPRPEPSGRQPCRSSGGSFDLDLTYNRHDTEQRRDGARLAARRLPPPEGRDRRRRDLHRRRRRPPPVRHLARGRTPGRPTLYATLDPRYRAPRPTGSP